MFDIIMYNVHDTVCVVVSFYFLQPLEGSQIPLSPGFITVMTGPLVPTTLPFITPPPPSALHPFFIEVAMGARSLRGEDISSCHSPGAQAKLQPCLQCRNPPWLLSVVTEKQTIAILRIVQSKKVMCVCVTVQH